MTPARDCNFNSAVATVGVTAGWCVVAAESATVATAQWWPRLRWLGQGPRRSGGSDCDGSNSGDGAVVAEVATVATVAAAAARLRWCVNETKRRNC